LRPTLINCGGGPVPLGLAIGGGRLSCERCQQGFSLLQINGVKALGEPVIDRCEQRSRFGALALALPQPVEVQRRAQLPELRLLAVSDVKGLAKTGFRFRVMLRRVRQQ
jgi:hypothetical protein